jgi:hypothetical protein
MSSAKPSGKPLVPAPLNSCLLSDPVFRNKSLGIVLSLSASSPFSWASYAAAAGAIATAMALRSGSYTSPLTHMQCSQTASFRATATAARFFAFFPPRSHSRSNGHVFRVGRGLRAQKVETQN